MAALRKASAYSKKIVRPFTRKSGKKSKAFIKTIPPSKIVKFNMGNKDAYVSGKHGFVVRFICEEKVQIRDNALESARLLLNKNLDKEAQGQYYLIVKVYPHHILRENKLASGAGADRLSSGMTHSYGANIGRAAIVNPGTEIFFISCESEKTVRIARKALTIIKSKLPCRGKIMAEKLN